MFSKFQIITASVTLHDSSTGGEISHEPCKILYIAKKTKSRGDVQEFGDED